MNLNPKRTQAAFTLIEVMVAAVIAAIMFSAVFSGISNSFAVLNTSRENLRATQIIVSRLEGLHLEAWEEGSGTNAQPTQLFNATLVPTNFTDYFFPLGLNGNSNNLGTIYSGTVVITTNLTLSPTASYGGALAQVTVSVQWTDVVNHVTEVHSAAMSTYIAQYGIQNYVYTH